MTFSFLRKTTKSPSSTTKDTENSPPSASSAVNQPTEANSPSLSAIELVSPQNTALHESKFILSPQRLPDTNQNNTTFYSLRSTQILLIFIIGFLSWAISALRRNDKDNDNVPYLALLGFFLLGPAIELLIHTLPARIKHVLNHIHQNFIPEASILEALVVTIFLGGWKNAAAEQFLAITSSTYAGLNNTTTLLRHFDRVKAERTQAAQLKSENQKSNAASLVVISTLNPAQQEKSPSLQNKEHTRRGHMWRIVMMSTAVSLFSLGRWGFNPWGKTLYGSIAITLNDLGLAIPAYIIGKELERKFFQHNPRINMLINFLFFSVVTPGNTPINAVRIAILGVLLGYNRGAIKRLISHRRIEIGKEEKIIQALVTQHPAFIQLASQLTNEFNTIPTKNILYNPEHRPIDKRIKGVMLFLVFAYATLSLATGDFSDFSGAAALLFTYGLAHKVEFTPYQDYKTENDKGLRHMVNWQLYYFLKENPMTIAVTYGYMLRHWHNMLDNTDPAAQHYANTTLLTIVATINCVLVGMARSWRYHQPYLGETLNNLQQTLQTVQAQTDISPIIQSLTWHQLRYLDEIARSIPQPAITAQTTLALTAPASRAAFFLRPDSANTNHFNKVASAAGKTSFSLDTMLAVERLGLHPS